MCQNRLTHTVTHTAKCLKSGGEDMLGVLSAALCFLLLVHITCAMKLPIFSAALSCICRVTWV